MRTVMGVVRLVLDNRRTCTIFLFINDLCSLRTGFNGLVQLVFAPVFVNYVNTCPKQVQLIQMNQ